MANVYRYRRGAPLATILPVLAATVIELGDFLFLDDTTNMRGAGSSTAGSTVFPFSSIAGGTNQAADEALASDSFIGIAMTPSPADDNIDVTVYRSGRFLVALNAAATVLFGAVIEVFSTAEAAVSDQVATPGTTDPLGRCIVPTVGSQSEVEIEIHTAFAPGGLIS